MDILLSFSSPSDSEDSSSSLPRVLCLSLSDFDFRRLRRKPRFALIITAVDRGLIDCLTASDSVRSELVSLGGVRDLPWTWGLLSKLSVGLFPSLSFAGLLPRLSLAGLVL